MSEQFLSECDFCNCEFEQSNKNTFKVEINGDMKIAIFCDDCLQEENLKELKNHFIKRYPVLFGKK